MTTLEFIEKKGREKGDAYCVIVAGNGWTYEVLKRYAKDDTKPYARWDCFVYGIHDEQGDTYVASILSIAALLIAVDNREPTRDEQEAFTSLKEALAQQEGGISIFG